MAEERLIPSPLNLWSFVQMAQDDHMDVSLEEHCSQCSYQIAFSGSSTETFVLLPYRLSRESDQIYTGERHVDEADMERQYPHAHRLSSESMQREEQRRQAAFLAVEHQWRDHQASCPHLNAQVSIGKTYDLSYRIQPDTIPTRTTHPEPDLLSEVDFRCLDCGFDEGYANWETAPEVIQASIRRCLEREEESDQQFLLSFN